MCKGKGKSAFLSRVPRHESVLGKWRYSFNRSWPRH